MTMKPLAFAFLAKQMVGINASNTEIINTMRKAVDGVASGEPWCACFVQHLAAETDQFFVELGMEPESTILNNLPKTESTQAMWYRAMQAVKHDWPAVGSVVVWRLKENQSLGHCGVVVEVSDTGIVTVEGNTSFPGVAGSEAERNGRGIWTKTRKDGQIPGFDKLGYLRPWG